MKLYERKKNGQNRHFLPSPISMRLIKVAISQCGNILNCLQQNYVRHFAEFVNYSQSKKSNEKQRKDKGYDGNYPHWDSCFYPRLGPVPNRRSKAYPAAATKCEGRGTRDRTGTIRYTAERRR